MVPDIFLCRGQGREIQKCLHDRLMSDTWAFLWDSAHILIGLGIVLAVKKHLRKLEI